MEKYYIVYIVSTRESRYSWNFSCASYYFNANSFKHSMTLSYSGLRWGCLRVLIYFPDLQHLCPVFLQGWANDIRKSITLCFSESLICIICSQTFLRSNIFSLLFFNRNQFQIIMCQYFKVLYKCCSTCYSFFAIFMKVPSLCVVPNNKIQARVLWVIVRFKLGFVAY